MQQWQRGELESGDGGFTSLAPLLQPPGTA
jgi:hypothetical protein